MENSCWLIQGTNTHCGESLRGMSNGTQKRRLCYRYATFSTLYAIEMVTAYPTAQDKPLPGWGRGIRYAKV